MMNREKICKGCKTYIDATCNYYPIIYKGTDKEQICPCSTCLVKGICPSIIECEYITDYFISMPDIFQED